MRPAPAALVSGVGLVVPGAESPADLVRPAVPEPADDWFDPVRHLGQRGWKYLSWLTRYLLAATGQALGPAAPAGGAVAPDRAATCLGSNHAISAMHAAMDATLRSEGVRGLSPAELPGFSVNTPASWLSIVRERRGFSVTLTDPLVAGLQALLLGVQAIRAGRVDDVLAGATEEAPAPGRAAGTVTGGACVLALRAVRPGEDTALAEVCAGVSRFLPPRAGRPDPDALAGAASAVARLVPPGADLPYAFCGPAGTGAVDAAVRAALAERGVRGPPAALSRRGRHRGDGLPAAAARRAAARARRRAGGGRRRRGPPGRRAGPPVPDRRTRPRRRMTTTERGLRRPALRQHLDDVPAGTWVECPQCRTPLYRPRLLRAGGVCQGCNRHLRIPVAERIGVLTDAGSFAERDAGLASPDPLGFTDRRPYAQRLAAARRKTGLDEAVVCVSGRIGGRPVALGRHGLPLPGRQPRQRRRRTDHPGRRGCVAAARPAGAGHRIGRGTDAGRPAVAHADGEDQPGARSARRGGVLTVTVVADPTYGGVAASFASLTDVVIAEPGARLGFAGPAGHRADHPAVAARRLPVGRVPAGARTHRPDRCPGTGCPACWPG